MRKPVFFQRGAYVEVEGLAERTGLLRAVEHGNLLAGFGKDGTQPFAVERAIQAYFDNADFFAVFIHFFHCFFHGGSAAAHEHDNVFCLWISEVIKDMVCPFRDFCHFVHDVLHEIRYGGVVGVRAFPILKIDIGILRCSAANGVFGRERTSAEPFDILIIEQAPHFLFVHYLDFAKFVRGAESVEKV